MFVNPVQNNLRFAFQSKSVTINGKKYVPLSEYNGPKLKLSQKDKDKIKALSDRIAILVLEHLSLAERYSYNLTAMSKRDCKDNAFFELKSEIESLEDEIENIKRNRYKEQVKNARLKL